MTPGFVAEERGQAVVIIAGAMVVLMAFLVLSVEWGYGFAERRGAQNDADAAALAVGRRLASTFLSFDRPFGATVDQLCLEAKRFSDSASGEVLTLTFADESQRVVPFIGDPPAQSVSTADCSAAAGRQLPADQPDVNAAVFVQVRATRTYPSVLGTAFGRKTMDAGASARTRLTAGALLRPLQLPDRALDPSRGDPGSGVSGLATAPSVAMWPIVHYFDPSAFAGPPCGAYCDRAAFAGTCGTAGSACIRLWQQAGGGPSSAFQGLTSLSHDAWRATGVVHQLVTESDWSGSSSGLHGHPAVPRLPTHGEGGCYTAGTPGLWDTKGTNTQSLGDAAHCDVPNWFWYGYRGSLSLDSNWTASGTWAARGYIPVSALPLPMPSPAQRYSCQGSLPSFPRPSCRSTSAQVGDWVQTLNGRLSSDGDCQGECSDGELIGDITSTMVANIRHFIAQYGRELPNSNGHKAIVLNVFMWDCADQYTSGAWTRLSDSACSPISDSTTLRRVGRIHLVTVVPVTVYDDGVTSSHLDGYWGDAFGDAGTCGVPGNWATAGCQLNPLINSAFLVPD